MSRTFELTVVLHHLEDTKNGISLFPTILLEILKKYSFFQPSVHQTKLFTLGIDWNTLEIFVNRKAKFEKFMKSKSVKHTFTHTKSSWEFCMLPRLF